jgi:hypothetical protein
VCKGWSEKTCVSGRPEDYKGLVWEGRCIQAMWVLTRLSACHHLSSTCLASDCLLHLSAPCLPNASVLRDRPFYIPVASHIHLPHYLDSRLTNCSEVMSLVCQLPCTHWMIHDTFSVSLSVSQSHGIATGQATIFYLIVSCLK